LDDESQGARRVDSDLVIHPQPLEESARSVGAAAIVNIAD
jgi:hypothetical protein